MKNRKGDVWVSAVIYLALGIVVVTLVLAAGVPLINKIRDKNTVVQTKKMLTSIDDNIRDVTTEGPGSKRVISPLEIGNGQLVVNTNNDYIEWKMTTKNKMMEPGLTFQEGMLNLRLDETIIKDEYEMLMFTNYTGLADVMLAANTPIGPFTGKYSLVVYNTGDFTPQGQPKISLGFL